MVGDKFIMMGLGDERSKDIADVLSNKTCKKIIDYLADTKEASEKDISDALSIPINTTEYNLNKLVKSGLVEKAKNFFWSTKGRKIDMYKLARKHIIISPKSKPNMKNLKTILPVILIAAVFIALAALFLIPDTNIFQNNQNPIPQTGSNENLKQFSSLEQLKDFLNTTNQQSGYVETDMAAGVNKVSRVVPSAAGSGTSSEISAGTYSKTNIQVEGVDEPDIMKNDDKYIYTLSGNKVIIVNAYPAENMNVISEIKSDDDRNTFRNIFINGDKLIVFSQGYDSVAFTEAKGGMCLGRCGGYSESRTKVLIYDIKDRANPVLERNISADGNYIDARMIGEYVYLISTKQIYYDQPVLPVYSIDGIAKEMPMSDVYYFDYYDTNYVFTSIYSINVNKDEMNSKAYLTGSSNQAYVSENNIYLTYQKSWNWQDYTERQVNEVYMQILPDSEKSKISQIMSSSDSIYEKSRRTYLVVMAYSMNLKGQEKETFDKNLQDKLNEFQIKIEKERDKSVIHKISVNKGDISYKTAGEVSGHILNQFSMDEYKGNFRVATTTGNVWGGNSLNHLYILDEELKIVGSLEDLAKGEKIYSARFMGDRAYIVTFKKVDPLFVIDVSNPNAPKVLGYLKIPGYSDYLHPYDANHVIGIGKDARDASSEEVFGRNLDFAWYQGVKISLFDVSDVENPIEQAKYVIGDRGTDSPVLSDHKALLFDKEKNLLVIPVSVAEIDRSKYRECSKEELNSPRAYEFCLSDNTYGEQVWQGAYVFNIDENEITLKGKITHNEIYTGEKYGAAKDEIIGATRTDSNGNVWTKINITNSYGYSYGQWKTNNENLKDILYGDYDIDTFPGGINYYPFNDYSKQIQRSLYMDDYLYTVSLSKIKANNLNDLSEIKSVDLGYSESNYYGGVVY